jgi:hypothetical protein
VVKGVNRSENFSAYRCKIDTDESEIIIFQGADMDKFSTHIAGLYNTRSTVVSKHPADVREVALRIFARREGCIAADSFL